MVIPKKAATKLRPFVLHAACCSCCNHLIASKSIFLKFHLNLGQRNRFSVWSTTALHSEACSFLLLPASWLSPQLFLWLFFAFNWFRFFFQPHGFFCLPLLIALFKPFFGDILSALKVVPKLILQASFEDCVGCMYPICRLGDSSPVSLCCFKKEL